MNYLYYSHLPSSHADLSRCTAVPVAPIMLNWLHPIWQPEKGTRKPEGTRLYLSFRLQGYAGYWHWLFVFGTRTRFREVY